MSETLAECLEKLKAVMAQLEQLYAEHPGFPAKRLTVLKCPVCENYAVRYTASGPSPTYCSERCRDTAEMRRKRARKKLQENI